MDRHGAPAAGGATPHRLRNHNERLVLSLIHRHGEIPGSEIARLSGLSPQTVSVILRKLEQDGLTVRGAPRRGRVGKPSTPVALAETGLLSVGLKLGRRTADLLLVDVHGSVLAARRCAYDYPRPATVFAFLEEGLAAFRAGLSPDLAGRIAGIGVAVPFQLWNWHAALGAPEGAMEVWRDIDIAGEIARFTDLPVFIQNDATAACRAEHVHGGGKRHRDYAYFFLGAFIGGGVVLGGAVHEGAHGNAGAFGSIAVATPDGPRQLIDRASIYLLEARLAAAGRDPQVLWRLPQDWTGFADALEPWIDQTAAEIAQASLTVAAIVDVPAVLVDGAFPAPVRERLVAAIAARLGDLDTRGLVVPAIEAGRVGAEARALGAASAPIFRQYFLEGAAGLGGA